MGMNEREQLRCLLQLTDDAEIKRLFADAYQEKLRHVGNKVFFRGLIELSNICVKDCYYCGIRKSNLNVSRYLMEEEEIVECALWAHQNRYGSIVLQSGERRDPLFADLIERVVQTIKSRTDGKLGITLSLGEQNEEVYKRWFDAGAHRFLLRIETSSKNLYGKLHPPDHDFEKRKNCLLSLKKIGYQIGTGVMIGLPMQTIDDLVNDLFFFKEIDADMIGMGPYLVSNNTPLTKEFENSIMDNDEIYILSLKMIAVARLFLKDINIAATTALQALKYFGREEGLKCGANIIMPNITLNKYREQYQLYNNKPCLDENADICKSCLSNRVSSIGEVIGYDEWGDSPHFSKTKKQQVS